MSRRFPITLPYDERLLFPACPATIPWDMISGKDAAAKSAYGFSLSLLETMRGGLHPKQVYELFYSKPGPKDPPIRMVDALALVESLSKGVLPK